MLNRAGFFRLRIVQKKIWKCGIFFVSLGGWWETSNRAGKIKFVYVRNFSYICITKILFITPNDIYESK